MKSKAYIDATIDVLYAKDKSAEEFGEALAKLMDAVNREVYDAIDVSKDYGVADRFTGVFDEVFTAGEAYVSGNYVSADTDDAEPDKSYCVRGYLTVSAALDRAAIREELLGALRDEFDMGCSCSHDCCGHWFMSSIGLQLTDCGIDTINPGFKSWAFTFEVSYGINV